jgi:SAM-dependent methyltransferase
MTARDHACAICRAASLRDLPAFAALPRVTSDCKPFPAGGRLTVCTACGAIQKIADAAWRSDIAAIYAEFALDAQSDGEEQMIFDAAGVGLPRSERMMASLGGAFASAESGRLLDFGCGGGATLKAFSRHHPGWDLYGAELSAANEARLQQIARFKKLYVGAVDAIDGSFDAITLIHSLAHVEEPVTLLGQLTARLAPEGVLLVQTPDAAANPYYLLDADVLVHFTAEVLESAARQAGLGARQPIGSPIVKELTYLGGRASPTTSPVSAAAAVVANTARVEADLRWLDAQMQTARRLCAGSKSFGIFGSSISAAWLAGCLDGRFDFFVDEDPRREGRTHLGRPIIAPGSVSAGAVVFVPLITPVARAVATRLRAAGITCEAA